MPPFKEKRQLGRVKIIEPTICQVYIPQSREFKRYPGLIKNISLGGIYFVCYEKLPLEKDDIQHLIFNVIYDHQKIYRLNFHALAVRTENWGSKFGVAIKFLSDPIYYPLKEIDRELPFLDKIRIMYQNYGLYRKVHEIIKKTPEIRNELIDNIKNLIDQDLYKMDQIEIAHSMTANFTEKLIIFQTDFLSEF